MKGLNHSLLLLAATEPREVKEALEMQGIIEQLRDTHHTDAEPTGETLPVSAATLGCNREEIKETKRDIKQETFKTDPCTTAVSPVVAAAERRRAAGSGGPPGRT